MAVEKSRSCGSVIYRITEDGSREYLLIKGFNLEWGFAKGIVEEGENDSEAAKREVKEETGLDVEFIDGFRETYHYRLKLRKLFVLKKVINKEVSIFLSEVTEDARVTTQKGEVIDYGWFDFDKALEIINFKERREILKKAEDFVKNTML